MGLFHHDDSAKKAAQLAERRATAEKYDAMVVAALQRLTRWAFPDSHVERVDDPEAGLRWQLAHTGDDGARRVDVSVIVNYVLGQPIQFQAHMKLSVTERTAGSGDLSREELDYALRHVISRSV